jgi:hypothetical protein
MAELLAGSKCVVQPQVMAVERRITVEIADPKRFSETGDAWRVLIVSAAVPNISMHPAVALAAQGTGRRVHVVLA